MKGASSINTDWSAHPCLVGNRLNHSVLGYINDRRTLSSEVIFRMTQS